MGFTLNFYGLSSCLSLDVPEPIQAKLKAAQTPKQIEAVIADHEAELAAVLREDDDCLICDTVAELMSQVLSYHGIEHKVICGINDAGNSHSYIQVGEANYDPTHQGFGENLELCTK